MRHCTGRRAAHAYLGRRCAGRGLCQWAVALVCLGCALAVAACGGSARAGGTPGIAHTPGATAANSPTPSATIPWRAVSLPSGVAPSQVGGGFIASPAEGRAAWVCAITQPGTVAVWATRDAGQTWRQMSTFTPALPEPAGDCSLSPDLGDGQALVASFSWGCGECGTLRTITYFSLDGGAHWRQLAGQLSVGAITQAGGTTYAMLSNTLDVAKASEQSQLVVSTDALRTWHRITPQGLQTSDSIANFWVRPQTGELLVVSAFGTLWRSEDRGQSWLAVAVAPGVREIQDARWLAAQQRWMLCGPGAGATSSNYACSLDLGQTWQPETVPTYGEYCPMKCGYGSTPVLQTQPCLVAGITGSGALLALCPPGSPAVATPAPQHFTVYRRALGATRWTALGIAPTAWLQIGADGTVWCLASPASALEVATLPGL